MISCKDLPSVRRSLTIMSRARGGNHFDFSKLQFIDPGAIVLLHFFSNLSKTAVNVQIPQRPEPRNYLLGNFSGGRLSLSTSTTYPLRYIKKETRVTAELGEWEKMLVASHALELERARSFSQNMSEVLANAFGHGKTSACIVAGQTFKKAGHSILAAADFGRTIPVTLSTSDAYKHAPRPDHEWIEFSLQKYITCGTRPSNAGLGLWLLAERVRVNGGRMTIVSGDGAVCVERSRTWSEPLGDNYARFPGTLIVLDLKTGTT